VNNGSSPFYYDWPIEIALLDEKTKAKVWCKTLKTAEVSKWYTGENWSSERNSYQVEAPEYTVKESLTLDKDLSVGRYIIAIACLDPAGNLPSLRFAVRNYFNGGRHPMGYIGVGKDIDTYLINSALFNDIQEDHSLYYVVDK
jgi:hypothetical protein